MRTIAPKANPSIAPAFFPSSIPPTTTGISVNVIDTIPPIGGISALIICNTTTSATRSANCTMLRFFLVDFKVPSPFLYFLDI
jgi:hypothetical protein